VRVSACVRGFVLLDVSLRSNRLRLLLLGLFHGLHWADQHVRVAAFEFRLALDAAEFAQVLGETQQQFLAEIGVGNLASAELHDSLHAVAFA
jgi:hypothetical protein